MCGVVRSEADKSKGERGMKGVYDKKAFMRRFEERVGWAYPTVRAEVEQCDEEWERIESRLWWTDLWWQLMGCAVLLVFITDLAVGYVRWLA